MKQSINSLIFAKKILESEKNEVMNSKLFKKNIFNMQSIDALKFADDMIGRKYTITMDSGIFRHNINDKLLDKTKDIYELYGDKDNKIEMDDIIDMFKKMQKQFDEMEKKRLDNRSYYYEGIEYDMNRKMYKIYWGS